nr:MAG TPA: hypothetical protein [Caudoviricetes sp.]
MFLFIIIDVISGNFLKIIETALLRKGLPEFPIRLECCLKIRLYL